MFSKLFRRSPKPQVRVVPVFRDLSRLRLSEWRATPDLVKAAAKCLADPAFRRMVDVLRNEALCNATIIDPIPVEQRAIWQARAEGYSMALNNLEALATFEQPKDVVEPTYEPAEQDTEPTN